MSKKIEMWVFKVNGGGYLHSVVTDPIQASGAAILYRITTTISEDKAMSVRGTLFHAEGFVTAFQRIFNIHLTVVKKKI